MRPRNAAELGNIDVELKEAVGDALVNMISRRASGTDEAGRIVYGRSPQRSVFSGQLLPRLADGNVDDTSDIHIAAMGLDFNMDANATCVLEATPKFSIYVRVPLSDLALELWSGRRTRYLLALDFYFEEAEKRVLMHFEDIDLEAEAEMFAHREFERMGQSAGPDADPADYADAAWAKGVDHYQMLDGLHGQMLLSVAAGLYHEWEKQLREWLSGELNRSFPREKVKRAVWKAKVDELLVLLKSLGWDVYAHPFSADIDECELVVNVYKHGEGPSFDHLRKRYPRNLGRRQNGVPPRFCDHTDLKISREDLRRFHLALKDFWVAVPENCNRCFAPTLSSPL